MTTDFDDNGKLTDVQLVGLAKQGDRDAFAELIHRHRRRCANLATAILRDRGEAEEETQNAFYMASADRPEPVLDAYPPEAACAIRPRG